MLVKVPTATAILATLLFGTAFSAQGMPTLLTATVENNGTNFSLIHDCATPSGCGTRLDFDASQTFDVLLDGGALRLPSSSTPSFSLEGGAAQFDLVSLYIPLDGSSNGMAGDATMSYRLRENSAGALGTIGTGPLDGVMTFEDRSYGCCGFNSVNFMYDGGALSSVSFALWGGDAINNIGLDFSATGRDPVSVPEPATALLLFLGMIIMGLFARPGRHSAQPAPSRLAAIPA